MCGIIASCQFLATFTESGKIHTEYEKLNALKQGVFCIIRTNTQIKRVRGGLVLSRFES